MAIAFVTNGLGAYGLRILAGAGLGKVDETQYLALWYIAGLILAITFALRRKGRFATKEFGIGLVMALCSVLGQTGMVLAMSGGIPGFVVFPVAVGGGLILVVLVGVFAFRERVSPLLCLGVASGLASLILLALPG
jgi:multidrug transporter EmrE-like cation transporter